MRTPFGELPGAGLIGRVAHLPRHVITMGGGRGGQPQIKGDGGPPGGEPQKGLREDPDPHEPSGGGRGSEP